MKRKGGDNMINFLIVEARQFYRQDQWVAAGEKYEEAGEKYSAMCAYHMALLNKRGSASELYRRISHLYHQVGNHERGKYYGANYRYQLFIENKKYAENYLAKNNITIDKSLLYKDLRGNMRDEDLQTFSKNLETYVNEMTAKS